MADSKITDLADGAPIQAGDEFVLARSGANNKIAGSALPGFEIGYDAITSSVNITGTAEGTPTTIITCGAHTFDGGPVLATFDGIVLAPNTSGGFVVVDLRESGTVIERMAYLQNAAAGVQIGLCAAFQIRFTPGAGSHSYVVAAWCSATSGTPNITAGSGAGAGNMPPAFIRFTKV